jgi:hypothetical protein
MVEFRVAALSSLTLLALLCAFSGCRSADRVVPTNYLLNTAYDRTSEGDYLEAIEILEALLGDLEPQRDEYVRQRFYAYYLLAQAHILQALEERGGVSEGTQQSHPLNPRVLAAMLHIGNVLDTLEAAKTSPKTSEQGEQLVPSRLEAITPEEIRTHVELLFVGFYGGLRFNDKTRILVDRFRDRGDLTRLETCEKLLESLHVVPGVRPWIEVGIQRYLRKPEPKEAFRFAISALHGEHIIPDQLTRAELIDWIDNGSKFKFLCNKCDEPVVPSRPACFNCGTGYLTAYGVEKEDG